MSEGDGEHDVLSHLPRSRPSRRSAKRGSPRGDAGAAAAQPEPKAKARPKAAAKPRAKKARATATGSRAKKPAPPVRTAPEPVVAKAKAKPIGAEVPPAGWASPSPGDRQEQSVDVVALARQAAGEVLGTVGKLLGRLPRP